VVKRVRKKIFLLIGVVMMLLVCSVSAFAASKITLKYAHMNSPMSVAGRQAEYFAKLVEEKTGGVVRVEVYPSSQLGNLQEQAEMVSMGTVALHHNTMAGIGSLYQPFEAFDTPYLYESVDHLLKVTDPQTSPIMQSLSQQLVNARNVRVLYTFYFGTRHLTCDRPIYKPEDLKGVKIRAIPFPIYMTAVEGLGAIAVPIDWAEVPTALATGAVNGQENPVNVVLANKFYETQKYLMLTGHIMGAEVVVMNEKTWQKLSPEIQQAIQEAAAEASKTATQWTIESEQNDIQALKEKGMTVIGPDEGLDIEAFRTSVRKLIQERFGEKYGEFYEKVKAMK
jgi:tripartite ATP-independent transporter DctP family solute receptor